MPSDVIKGFVYTSAKNIVSVAKNQERADLKRFYNIEILAIDDLGTEPRESISYGDYITATTDIILHRYDRQLTTLCTSNLVAKEIANYYDERVADRFREMMKIINFGKTPSFR
jgi:DNA replication protein DnaC